LDRKLAPDGDDSYPPDHVAQPCIVVSPTKRRRMIALSLTRLVLLFLLGVGAGWLGAWIGIGGGVVLVPALVLGFGVDMKGAITTSLVAVIVTSTAAGSVYVGRSLTNTRVAIALEVATTLGGICGSLLALAVPSNLLAGMFAAAMAARVGVLVAVWIRQRDDRFVILALLVMAILVVSALAATL
jgi:uncharacterized membrane protein YfcA